MDGGRAAPIRGRSAELAVLDEAISAVASGHGSVLVLEGPPGIGKSRLLAEACQRAGNRGVRALHAQGFEYQQSAPFYALFAATLHADPPVGDAESLRRSGDVTDLRYWVVHDLRAAIHAAAASQPLMIVLDDIHWADNATLLALRSLAVGDQAPVLWVLATRTGAGGAAARQAMAELRRAGATLVRLAPLAPEGVVEIVQDAVRARADRSLLDLAAMAHGSPFLLIELLRGLDEEGRLDVRGGRAGAEGDQLPRRLALGMEQRLDELAPDTAAVVRVAATLPDHFSVALLAAVLDRPPAALMPDVQAAIRADLLAEHGDALTFRHELLRSATRASMPRSLCRAMERQSAGAMLEMGAPPEEVATQLARSAEAGDQTAVGALRDAARSAGRSDPSVAADLSRRAVELLPPGDPQVDSLVAETVLMLNRAHRYREAQELADTTLSSPASQEGEAEIRLRIAAGNEAPEQRIAENRRALELSIIDDVTRVRHTAWLAYFETVNGIHTDASSAGRAMDAATANGDLEARIVSATALGMVDLQQGYALRAIRRMDEVAALARLGEPTLGHIVADIHRVRLVVTVGCLEEAGAEVADCVERARRDRYAMALPPWAVLEGTTHAAAGRLAEARAAVDALPMREWGTVTENNLMRMVVLSEVGVRTDDRNMLQQLLTDAHALSTSTSPLLAGGAAYLIALVAWHRGDVYEAARRLGGPQASAVTPLWLNVFDQLLLTARVAVAADDAALRVRAADGIEVLERERPGAPLFAAVASYGRSILERDADALLDAANSLHPSRPLLHAGAAEDAGRELVRAGRRREGVEQFNVAFDTFATCQAVADARRVGRLLRGQGVERRIVVQPRSKSGWDSLTDAELRVVNAIADGGTNREVAAQLQLSPNTVKAHVRNAFAKLGIRSRRELARSIDDGEPGPKAEVPPG
ncbi:helix-turn-helix transcriptional regulator (plasmid) [Mycolicibacterium arabiense]|uniref:Helix-turn-helix transcriptional regulator n=1 Tax=Mycolicibacterium arabiense TaxID=1286181 RepID=A0A7I7RQB2_9MYCO|nr:helix-turn-helix transcriptional regulator [Mycolicibacterium arabiense]